MPKRIFIGGLSAQTTSDELQSMFTGLVQPVSIRIADADDGRSREAYVEMASDEDAAAAIQRLNGRDLNGRKVMLRAQ